VCTHCRVRDSSTPFWRWMNLLSLDAPLLALVWQDFLARCYPSLLLLAGRWVLADQAVGNVDYPYNQAMSAVPLRRTRRRFYRQNRSMRDHLNRIAPTRDRGEPLRRDAAGWRKGRVAWY
jgi:hypothetical protein